MIELPEEREIYRSPLFGVCGQLNLGWLAGNCTVGAKLDLKTDGWL